MAEPRNTINVPVAGSNRFEQDVVMAISRLKASVMSPDSAPSFANLSLTDLDASKLSGTDADKSFQSINVGNSITLTGTTLDTIQDIRATASPTFTGLTLSGLTATRLLASDGVKALASTALNSWVTGTANRVTVADDGDGTITLSTPQDTHTGASPQFTALTLTATDNPLDAGGWVGKPDPISAHSNIYGDLYVGNADIANLGRFRIGSNQYSGFLQWNRYYDGADSQQMDVTQPSFAISVRGGGSDCFSIQRSPAGSTTLADLLYIAGATGVLTLPYMSSAGFVKNDISGNLSGGNTLGAGDIPDLSGTYQPLDADLTAIAALAVTDGNFIVGNGSTWVAESGATARTSLGLGTGNTPTFESLTLTKALNPILKLQSNSSSATESGEIQFWSLNTDAGPRIRIVNDESGENLRIDVRRLSADAWTSSLYIFRGAAGQEGRVGIKIAAPQENLHVADTIRADTAFNLNGTDGITVTDTVITALQDNAGQLQYKSKTITFTGGIRTATGAESGWTDVPAA